MSATTIREIDPFLLAIPVAKPGAEAKNKYLAGVLVHTKGGIVGTGLSAVRSLPFDPFAAPVEALIRDALVGQEATEVRRLWQQLADSKLRQAGIDGTTTAARAAVDIALWDISAQHAGLPLHRLLGTHKREGELWTYVTAGDPEWEASRVVETALALHEQGWRAIKLKVGRPDPLCDARMLCEVRERLGDDVRLMADATQLWSWPQAAAFCAHAEGADLTWIEEPCLATDVAAHQRLAGFTRTPIALGESLSSAVQLRDFLAAGVVQIVQADATRLAGITEWLSAAGLAECFGAALVPHHSEFGQAQQHCAFATRGAVALEFPWDAGAFADPVRKDGNTIVRPEAVGAGTTLRPEALADWRLSR
jgi:L-alanine-DL-glutamate epimerase-like enolase superfamily enzyme